MDFSWFTLSFGLVEKACLVLIAVYLLIRTGWLTSLLDKKSSFFSQIILAVLFGLFALYGTYSGIKTSGAIANIRNLGPMMGGLVGGPWVGLGAGLIGGIHRYFIGGFTDVACALGTIISGLAAGIMYMVWKGKIGVGKSALFAFIMEIVDMGLLLLIARPFNDAWNLVQIIAIPMITADTIGIALFALMMGAAIKGKQVQ
jgi:sigma-B regulation protein RsbU (phosphoserine phosphatase)